MNLEYEGGHSNRTQVLTSWITTSQVALKVYGDRDFEQKLVECFDVNSEGKLIPVQQISQWKKLRQKKRILCLGFTWIILIIHVPLVMKNHLNQMNYRMRINTQPE